MLFVVTAIDKPDSLAVRLSVREAHFAYAKATGCIRVGGPFLDSKDEMCGSLMIVEAGDIDTVRAWHAQDPYVLAGLFASSDIRPWKPTFNPIEAKL